MKRLQPLRASVRSMAFTPGSMTRVREFARRMLSPSTPEGERARRAHALALILVASIAALLGVSGLTDGRVPFTLYAATTAAIAATLGVAPALVSGLGATLVLGALQPEASASDRAVFLLTALALAATLGELAARRTRMRADLEAARGTIADLEQRDRNGRRAASALDHVERVAPDAAVIVLNGHGIVTFWGPGATRLYGYEPDEMLGRSANALAPAASGEDVFDTMAREAVTGGAFARTDVHVRKNGTRFHVAVSAQPLDDADEVTVVVRDLAQHREWEAYATAAERAQAALQQAAEAARARLETLEHLVDPELNLRSPAEAAAELLERLRLSIAADGIALVPLDRARGAAGLAAGLQPSGRPGVQAAAARYVPGRVTLVHNDAGRVAQASAAGWPDTVTSLMCVPVVHDARVRAVLEIASERSRRATDWDVALVRVAADRLAAFDIGRIGEGAAAHTAA